MFVLIKCKINYIEHNKPGSNRPFGNPAKLLHVLSTAEFAPPPPDGIRSTSERDCYFVLLSLKDKVNLIHKVCSSPVSGFIPAGIKVSPSSTSV